MNNLYNQLIFKKNELLEDIKYTEKALEDKYIDYTTKREYNNDIISDRLEIDKIDGTLDILLPYVDINQKKVKVKKLNKIQ